MSGLRYGMKLHRNGVSRIVILVGSYALKLPRFDLGWRNGLWGLLANMQEREFSTLRDPRACPVLLALPGGWLLVMPRCTPLSDADWKTCPKLEDWSPLPVEPKRDSFGVLDGRIVAVDYGS